jgi:molybdopterin synthase catalytic subunit
VTPPAPSIDVQLVNHPVCPGVFEPFPDPAGGECLFLGRTRREDHPRHGRLVRLCYEAHVPLAQRVLHDLAQQAVARHGCLAVRIHHALGPVAVGEASVLVQTVTPHRAEAFGAARFLIDRLKQVAPIWKREEWALGATWAPGVVADMQERS